MNAVNQNKKTDDDMAADFLKGAVPSSLEKIELLTKKEFLPWHMPRKQWLRMYQWNSSIAHLAQDLHLADAGRPLNYLSLPGQDLLDIRSLSPVCEEIGIKLKFLGLNFINPQEKEAKKKQVEQDLSENEVRGMISIDPASLVINEKFEDISREESVTYDKLINSHDTFDVVNIDLCNSFGANSPADNKENLYDALHNLFSKQADSRNEDWLFFITTRNSTHAVHDDVWEIFVKIINKKAEIDSDFLANLVAKGIIAESSIENGMLTMEKLSRRCRVGVFGISIGFWIAHLLIEQRPAWKVTMLPSYGYHVHQHEDDNSCDMISLGFRFNKVRLRPRDPHDLARNLVGDFVDETMCRTESENQIIDQHCNQVDIDIHLYENPVAFTEALEKSKQLLAAARYDIDYYLSELDRRMGKLLTYLAGAGLIKEAA